MRQVQGMSRRRTAAERENYAAMRPFALLSTPGGAEHEALVEGLLTEGRMRARIAELQEFRCVCV